MIKVALCVFLRCVIVLTPPGVDSTVAPSARLSDESVRSEGGTYLVSIAPGHSSWKINEFEEFTVSVSEAQTRKPRHVDGIKVEASMPSHYHYANVKTKIDAISDNSFRVRGFMLHMPGPWEVYFDVREGNTVERAVIRVTM